MLSDYLGGKVLLVSAHADDVLFSYAAGAWSKLTLPQARGIAVGEHTAVAGLNEVVYFNPQGKQTITIHTPDFQAHEAVHDADDVLWVTAPKNSALVTIDARGATTEQWRVPGVDTSTDNRSHVNGVALKDGKPAYVTVLGVSNQPNGWRDDAIHEKGALININTNELVLHDLFMPHSPRWRDGKVWFLNSGHGELCTWTPGDKTRTVVAKFAGFSRGLLLTDTHAFIGISQGRITAFPNLTTDPLAQPGIIVIDRTTGERVFAESLDVQEIFDIQLSGVPLVG